MKYFFFFSFSREEAHHRMQLIRERSERDKTIFNSELRDLQRIIDHDQVLRDFMNTKLEERAEFFETIIQERKQKKTSVRMNNLQNQIEIYEDIFHKLKEVNSFLLSFNFFFILLYKHI